MRTERSAAKKTALLGILLALGIVLNLAENMIPIFTVLPGGKLGLANVVTMTAMVWFGPMTALLLGVLRSALCGILSGAVTMAFYGGTGTLLSVAAMWTAKRIYREKIGMAGLGMLGAVFFNFGQVAVAAAVIHNIQMFRYLPVLTLISTISGCVTGTVTERILRKKEGGAEKWR